MEQEGKGLEREMRDRNGRDRGSRNGRKEVTGMGVTLEKRDKVGGNGEA